MTAYDAAVLADHPLVFWPMTDSGGGAFGDATGHGYDLPISDPAPGFAFRANVLVPGTGEPVAYLGSPSLLTLPPENPVFDTPSFTLEFWVGAQLSTLSDPGDNSFGFFKSSTDYGRYANSTEVRDDYASVEYRSRALLPEQLGTLGFIPERIVWFARGAAETVVFEDDAPFELYARRYVVLRRYPDLGVDYVVNAVPASTLADLYIPHEGPGHPDPSPETAPVMTPAPTLIQFPNDLVGYVAYYDYALSDQRILAHYNAGIGAAPPPVGRTNVWYALL